MPSLIEQLQSGRHLLFDGAVGTELQAQNCTCDGTVNSRCRQQLEAVHRSYIQAGSQVILTNTITTNRLYFAEHFPGCDAAEQTRQGAAAALEAAAGKAFVLGSVGQGGGLLPPFGTATAAELRRNFAEQAAILDAAGVDGFMVETITDVEAASCAVAGIRSVSQLPILVSMAFATTARGCRTFMGHTAAQAAAVFARQGVAAIGANCGQLAPGDMLLVTALLQELTTLPLAVRPNAGQPRFDGSGPAYAVGPAEFSAIMIECARQGARLLGGCCGIGPSHIRALAAALTATRL